MVQYSQILGALYKKLRKVSIRNVHPIIIDFQRRCPVNINPTLLRAVQEIESTMLRLYRSPYPFIFLGESNNKRNTENTFQYFCLFLDCKTQGAFYITTETKRSNLFLGSRFNKIVKGKALQIGFVPPKKVYKERFYSFKIPSYVSQNMLM